MERVLLSGGVGNAGAVYREGDVVARPANSRSAQIHDFLRRLRAVGFDAAPEPLGLTADEERLRFVDGDAPIPPYPQWAQRDELLVSLAELMRRFHAASARTGVKLDGWSNELADPHGGTIVCHNDVCWENVVVRDGTAIALLDFDCAAPGRGVYDLACMARMCVPIDDDVSARRNGWIDPDRPSRLRLVADSYGLDASGRRELLACLDHAMSTGGDFVRRHAEAGHPGFVAMWTEMGGMVRYDRRRQWFEQCRDLFVDELGVG